jgi:hypothetical protein
MPGLSLVTANHGPINTNFVDVNYVPITENIENVIINLFSLMMNEPSATVEVSQSQVGGVADYVISAGAIASKTLDRTSGVTALLTITAGGAGVTLTGLRVRGQLISVARTHEEMYPANVEAQILAGADIKIYRPDVLSGVSRATAATIAQLYVSYYSEPRPTINITIVNSIYSVGIDAELRQEISNRITAQVEHLGLDADFYVEQITQSIVGTRFITTLGCEKVM